MRFKNVYFINGTAYAGKSTMVKKLAEKHGGFPVVLRDEQRTIDETLAILEHHFKL